MNMLLNPQSGYLNPILHEAFFHLTLHGWRHICRALCFMNDKLYEDETWSVGTPTLVVNFDVIKITDVIIFDDVIRF